MASFDTTRKNAKRNNRRLVPELRRELRFFVGQKSDEESENFWDNYESVEAVQRTHQELSD